MVGYQSDYNAIANKHKDAAAVCGFSFGSRSTKSMINVIVTLHSVAYIFNV